MFIRRKLKLSRSIRSILSDFFTRRKDHDIASIGMISVASVLLTKKAGTADVFCIFYEYDTNLAIKILKNKAKKIRSVIAKKMSCYTVPKLYFKSAETIIQKHIEIESTINTVSSELKLIKTLPEA